MEPRAGRSALASRRVGAPSPASAARGQTGRHRAAQVRIGEEPVAMALTTGVFETVNVAGRSDTSSYTELNSASNRGRRLSAEAAPDEDVAPVALGATHRVFDLREQDDGRMDALRALRLGPVEVERLTSGE